MGAKYLQSNVGKAIVRFVLSVAITLVIFAVLAAGVLTLGYLADLLDPKAKIGPAADVLQRVLHSLNIALTASFLFREAKVLWFGIVNKNADATEGEIGGRDAQ